MKNVLFAFLSLVFTSPFLLSSCETLELTEKGLLVPLTVVDDSSLPYVFVNGTLLHSEAFGNPTDPMMVVIHGGPGADYRSNLNYRDLANDGLYIVFYDQRGSGLSQRHDESFYEDKTVQFFIDDLAAVIEHYRTDENQKVILAGHSWGAMLATAYINQNPDFVAGAILAEPGGFTWPQTEDYINRVFEFQPFSENTNDFVYTDQFITGDDHETLDYKFALTASSENTGDEGQLPFWRAGAVLAKWAQEYAPDNQTDMDFTTNLSQYDTKVLFAYSELNSHYGEAHAVLVSSAYPNVQLEQIGNCGHEIIHFGWTDFYPLVLEYIEEIL